MNFVYLEETGRPHERRIVVECSPSWWRRLLGAGPVRASFVGGGTVWRDEATGHRAGTSLEYELQRFEWLAERERP